MATVTKRLSVDQYDQMIEHGILPETPIESVEALVRAVRA